MDIGKLNLLKINRSTEFGLYLMDENEIEALLPNRYVTDAMKIGEEIEVFVYNDSEDRRTATTEKPILQLNEFALLEVVQANKFGAFLNWGLPKDLLVPFIEQGRKLQEGDWAFVCLLLDEKTDRLYATTKINKCFSNDVPDLNSGDEINILPYAETDLGVKVVVNQLYQGMIFYNNVHKPVEPGEAIKGYVKQVRPDFKIDVLLEPLGYQKSIDKYSTLLINAIKKAGGFLKLTDQSSPEEINLKLGISKKAFKKAVGNLYKRRIIELEVKGIKLLK